ncbi:MAG: hypothetical protein HY976_03645 [Candidatus Kerfeldbacteria bacterium]|nr:hypothetical protein [Candidatus Kerfeldbacteria bacterium]
MTQLRNGNGNGAHLLKTAKSSYVMFNGDRYVCAALEMVRQAIAASGRPDLSAPWLTFRIFGERIPRKRRGRTDRQIRVNVSFTNGAAITAVCRIANIEATYAEGRVTLFALTGANRRQLHYRWHRDSAGMQIVA